MSKEQTSSLKLTFLGGADSIGASCTLVEGGHTRLLIDCGIRMNPRNPLPDLSQLSGKPPDALLVTHAHMDHAGALPIAHEAFPGIPVIATPPTIDLMDRLLRDAVKIMNSADREGELSLYSEIHVQKLLTNIFPIHHGHTIRVDEFEVTYFPASHILGASMIHLATPYGTLLFTGDYSVSAQLTVPSLSSPSFEADIVVSEATYGERLHEDRKAAERRLTERITSVANEGGRILIPAFAVGRAQEVLLILKNALRKKELSPIPIFVDGMVRDVCGVYARHERYASRFLGHEIRRTGHPFFTDLIRPVATPEGRQKALQTRPAIIVASSGMLSGGASVFYAREIAQTESDAILITGYQDEESPGRALLEIADGVAPRKIRLGTEPVDLKCHVEKYTLSAHADKLQMVAFLETLRPRTVILVHGEEAARRALARSLSCRDVILPGNGDVVACSTRRSNAIRTAPDSVSLDAIDMDRARELLGPPRKTPLRSGELVKAWFGGKVGRELADKLIVRLEEKGLVRRDDNKRSLLWILGPGETDLFGDMELGLVQLKQENPKGRLLELCMRLRIDPPETVLSVDCGEHVAQSALQWNDRSYNSGPCRSPSSKAAEQLAARALLEQIAARESTDSGGAVVMVDEEDAGRLTADNPKGRLLELCMQRRLALPALEHQPVPGGFQVRIVSGESGSPSFVTKWYQSPARKRAEQAAARELLGFMVRFLESGESLETAQTPDNPNPPKSGSSNERDPRLAINELRQAGVIRDFGYEEIDRSGPSHRPVFTMVGWVTVPNGERIDSAPAEASSKKEAQRAAAELLNKRLAEAGILPRGSGD
ncbi:MAG: MBL fold metallo-hydrolase [Candidatus Eisenbacteria bacterium]|uniref:MBL fold metallo-hydrolase n=1 Tax=Eiseniibacteriota bacterium TaxID=2212470 RepID=A0A948WE74_UNCEI|nr:MBL fold metallo-hydrolase [Candidatus Eisenbacteria bacterium]MBU1949029.1 MBL fold metallo-hydrolase [Candidatus Eisenbacteria bacterium]MBU2692513.1 MBL fold metallo-hydrolase [Candidatus Eisenbacteria bacterium]